MAGASFAMLRQSFIQQRRHASRVWRTGLSRIVINFGGSDPTGMTAKTLRGLFNAELAVEIDVILGANAKEFSEISAMSESSVRGGVRVHQFVDDMAAILAKADLAIGAGGSSLLESCCLGLPSLIVTTAPNQELMAKNMADLGAAMLLGGHRDFDEAQFVAAVSELADCDDKLANMAQAAASVCDGRGGLRIASALLPPIATRDGIEVSLRGARPEDEQVIFDWQSEPNSRRFFPQPTVPSREDHAAWFKQRLADGVNITLIVLVAGVAAGMVRLDHACQTDDYDAMEISIIIATANRGAGVGSAALELAAKSGGLCRLIAEVDPANTASVRAFEHAGFEHAGKGKFQTSGQLLDLQ